MNILLILSIILILLIIFTVLILLIVYYNKFNKVKHYLMIIIESINNNLYLYLLPFPLIYLFYYYFYYRYGKSNEFSGFLLSSETVEYMKTISIVFFSGGIFSATMKLINNMVIFKKNFQKIILSDDFDELLKDKFQILSLSNEFLLNRTDIHDIWSRVTTCQFEQAFPSLKDPIIRKLENDFFNENMLAYYYRNFRIQINFELIEDKIIRITEVSNFEVQSKNTEPINLDFKISSFDLINEDNEDQKIYTKLIKEDCKLDDKEMIFSEKILNENDKIIKVFSTKLENNQKYLIERKIEMTQYLEEDRVFSFSSSIIIDNIFVEFNKCESLQLFFSSVGKNKFVSDNHRALNTRICRDVLLPGEKFKVFIYKNS